MTKTSRKPSAPKGEKATQVMEQVVTKLIEDIEAGASTWTMPWSKLGKTGLPHNPVSKIVYSGGNTLVLWVTAVDRGYPTQQWATYNQWSDVKAQVRKGEKGTTCLKWVTKAAERDEATNEITKKAYGFYVPFSVFNIAQVDNAPDFGAKVELTSFERVEAADQWLQTIPAEIRHGGDRAFYSPSGDYIQLPEWDQFKSTEGGYATAAHELAHWTGHTSRLNREFGKRFGDDAYAAEELVAELSSAFTCALLGIDTIARPDHAAYLTNWCSMLRADPSKLWTVASKASAATTHLFSYAEDLVPA